MKRLSFEELEDFQDARFEHTYFENITLTALDIGFQASRNKNRHKRARLTDLHAEEPITTLPAIKAIVDRAFDLISVSAECIGAF